MASIVRDGDALAYAEANDAFHSAIYEGAHNAYLDDITRSTRARLQPFRRAQFGARGRLGKSHAEHALIVAAIMRADQAAAASAMRSHISIVETAYKHLNAS
jgi:DNA-binding GntR family transcriptional regulator